MWIIPSRGRPDLAHRVFSLFPPSTPGVVAIDDDEVGSYTSLVLPSNWSRMVLPRMFLAQKLNAVFSSLPDEPFYGIINDDMLPSSSQWDIELVKSAGAWGIAWADDELNHRIGGAAFGGDLVRSLGWLACPAVKHFYIDDAHELIARELNCGVPRMDVKIAHLHFSSGKGAYDKTYQIRPDVSADGLAFRKWLKEEWPETKSRLLASFALVASTAQSTLSA